MPPWEIKDDASHGDTQLKAAKLRVCHPQPCKVITVAIYALRPVWQLNLKETFVRKRTRGGSSELLSHVWFRSGRASEHLFSRHMTSVLHLTGSLLYAICGLSLQVFAHDIRHLGRTLSRRIVWFSQRTFD